MQHSSLRNLRDRLHWLQQRQEQGAFVAPELRQASEQYREARARMDAARAIQAGRRAA